MKRSLIILIMLFSTLFCHGQNREKDDVISTTVEFVVNTNNFIHNTNYTYFINEFVPFIKTNADNIEYILLIGSASPEGNYDANVVLANKRADKIYSYISDIVPKNKILKDNNYLLFLAKTKLDERDYTKLRATYIEIHMRNTHQEDYKQTVDTVYIVKKDTIKQEIINNYYNYTISDIHNKPVFAVYNDLLSDLLLRANIGAEVYFNKMSFFVEGSFSRTNLFGKAYNIDIWHAGFRKYFNDNYNKLFIELHANAGYFDTELFSDMGKIGVLYGGGIGIGYAFDLCPHWKIYPILRIGLFERVYYADYYYTETGNINISFGNYSNGKIDNTENINNSSNTTTIVNVTKTINKEFFDNSNKAHYIGPTFIGIVLKRDFCISKKR